MKRPKRGPRREAEGLGLASAGAAWHGADPRGGAEAVPGRVELGEAQPHGADASFTIKARIEVADQLSRQDRFAEEADQREEIVAALGSSLGPDTLSTVAAEMRLVGCLVRLEHFEEADRVLAHVVAVRTQRARCRRPRHRQGDDWSAIVAGRLGRAGSGSGPAADAAD